MNPQAGDIWVKAETEYYLFLTDPHYNNMSGFITGCANALALKDGTIETIVFPVYNEDHWWIKVV